MLVIGLTGGVASGKSLVSAYFAQLGAPVIDADEIARELAEPGGAAFEQITAAFGRDILNPEGRIDRRRLRRIVFADPRRRRELEAILHPLVFAVIAERLKGLTAPYCILSVPLLIETGQKQRVDRVLVVDAPLECQRHRLEQRDHLPADEIEAMLAAQATRAERLRAAQDVIVNDADVDKVRGEVERLHRRYLTLAVKPPAS